MYQDGSPLARHLRKATYYTIFTLDPEEPDRPAWRNGTNELLQTQMNYLFFVRCPT